MSGPACYEQLGIPFQRHSDTSRAAAESVRDGKPTALRRVYVAILMAGRDGLTDEEGAELLNMNPNTYRPRRVELSRSREDRPALLGCDGSRATRSGRWADVWVAMFTEMDWENHL